MHIIFVVRTDSLKGQSENGYFANTENRRSHEVYDISKYTCQPTKKTPGIWQIIITRKKLNLY